MKRIREDYGDEPEPILCPACNRAFDVKDDLWEHWERSHLGDGGRSRRDPQGSLRSEGGCRRGPPDDFNERLERGFEMLKEGGDW